jgi:predicted permease
MVCVDGMRGLEGMRVMMMMMMMGLSLNIPENRICHKSVLSGVTLHLKPHLLYAHTVHTVCTCTHCMYTLLMYTLYVHTVLHCMCTLHCTLANVRTVCTHCVLCALTLYRRLVMLCY